MTIDDRSFAVNYSARDRVYQWIKKPQYWFFPPTCLLCGAAGEHERDLCGGCRRDLPTNSPACANCALPLTSSVQALCGQCQQQPPNFARTVAPWLYQAPLDYLIKALKFQGRLSAARLLSELFSDALLSRAVPLPQAIVPVPLHPFRIRERGFNQSLELARPIAKQLNIPVLADAVRRVRPTPPQMHLDATNRRRNVRGAFIASRAVPMRHVAVLDDVMTTGSTVAEVAKVLQTAGVQEISIWAWARTSY